MVTVKGSTSATKGCWRGRTSTAHRSVGARSDSERTWHIRGTLGHPCQLCLLQYFSALQAVTGPAETADYSAHASSLL